MNKFLSLLFVCLGLFACDNPLAKRLFSNEADIVGKWTLANTSGSNILIDDLYLFKYDVEFTKDGNAFVTVGFRVAWLGQQEISKTGKYEIDGDKIIADDNYFTIQDDGSLLVSMIKNELLQELRIVRVEQVLGMYKVLEKIPVFKEADAESEQIGTLLVGSNFKVNEIVNVGWFKIELANGKGCVMRKGIEHL